tara:strand:+ start:1879 stop:2436 length:558 start_codon:yes stop_codon:yes gene_type:complete
MELYEKYKSKFKDFEVNSYLRKVHFMAQIEHESNLKPVSENLNYSESALLRVFGKYFTEETAKEYARQPEKIANIVYANRMGNDDTDSGDGWSYRGKGFIQLTGKNNYKSLSEFTGIDYVSNPEMLLNEPDAMIAALWFWKVNNINKYADNDDLRNVTRRINGGYNGISHRTELLKKWKKNLKIK